MESSGRDTFPRRGDLAEGDGGVFEVFAKEAFDEGSQVFAGLREDEALGGVGPVELKASGLGGDPDLANGGVGGKNELSWAVLEEDVENAVVFFRFEASGLLGGDEGLLE